MALVKIREGESKPPLKTGYAFEEVTFSDGRIWLCASARRFRHHWNEQPTNKVLLHKLIPLNHWEMGLRTGRFQWFVPETLTHGVNCVGIDDVRFRSVFSWITDNTQSPWSWELLYHTAPFTTDHATYGIRYWFDDRDTALTFRLTWT